ncbi:MAG: WD40/YVTN/BNR-like repeat-containing protein [Gemmatimonadaceae bacterium]
MRFRNLRSIRHLPSLAFLAAIIPAAVGAQYAGTLDAAAQDVFRWRSVGPSNMSARVTDIEAVVGNPKVFYIAYASSGIWKTENGGTTFKPVFDTQDVISIGDIAIAPSNPNVIYAGTGEEDGRNSISPGGGVYKSTDAGKTWVKTGLEKTRHIGRVVVHPTNPDIAWVAALGNVWASNPERGLYRTEDGGKTWTLAKFVSDKAGFIDLAINPKDPSELWATSWEFRRGPYFMNSGGPGSGLWKSNDGGKSWREIKGNGFPAQNKGRVMIDVHRANPKILYAMVEADTAPNPVKPTGPRKVYNYPGDPGDPPLYGIGLDIYPLEKTASGLYRSDDGGETWRHINKSNTRPFYFSLVRVDPVNPDRVYWGNNDFFFSNDGGKTSTQGANDIHIDWHAMWIDPNDPHHFMVGGDGGIGITRDNGGAYEFINTHAVGQFYAISYDMQPFYRVCGGLQDNGTWCGPSRTTDSDGILHQDWFQVGGGDGFYSAQDPDDPDMIFYESQGGNIGRVNLKTMERKSLRSGGGRPRRSPWSDSLRVARGDTTQPLTPAITARLNDIKRRAGIDSASTLRFNWQAPMVMSVHNPRTLYAGGNKLIKSVNRGDQWSVVSPDLSWQDSVRIRTSMQSTGGITKDVTGAEVNGTITTIGESTFRPGLIWVGTDDGRVWLTRNDGTTWEDITPRFRGKVPEKTWVSRVEASRIDSNTVYVTFDAHRDGDLKPYVFVSNDAGKSFRALMNGLPTDGVSFVHVIREDPVNANLLYLGTDVGAYVSTNKGVNWQRFGSGLPTVPVHDLKVHPVQRELIAGTHGRSVWVNDVSALQELTDAVTAKGSHLFTLRTAYQFGTTNLLGATQGHQLFIGDNPPYGAAINYHVGAGGSGNARIVITDAAGATVRELTAPGSAGLHRVYWDLRGGRGATPAQPSRLNSETRSDRPGESSGAAAGGGRFARGGGAPVAAGQYMVTLTVNGVTTRQMLTVEQLGPVAGGFYGGDDDQQ